VAHNSENPIFAPKYFYLLHLPSAVNLPVLFIDQPEALERCLQHLALSPTLSFDLEFDSNRNSYGFTLCLIQVATPDTCYVIDPLVNLDLGGLYALFETESIQKIVHTPGEDLRLLHSLGCYPKNLFDTEVVARLLNYEQTSLAAMLREKLNHEMSKKHQKSNWLRRPLLEEQVQYAADDVTWLLPLKSLLEAEAAERGLMPFVREEQDLLSTTIHRQVVKTNFLKPSDLHSLSPREQHITNELLRFRDELARSINKPAYQVMSEELVRDLANGTCPPDQVMYEAGVHARFRNSRFAAQLSDQIRQAKSAATEAGLSAEIQGRERMTPERHAAIQKAAHDRDQVFAPIQQGLVQRYGPFAAQFMLSNRMVNEIVKGAVALRDLPAYRQSLFQDIAADQGIDLGSYFL
jgi:ribonuclease D